MAADDLQRRLDITQRLDRLNRERQVQANRALTYPAYYAGNDGGTSLARMSDGRVEATGKSISNGMLLPNQPLRMAGGKGLQSRPDTVPLVKLDQPVVKVTEEMKIKYLY